MTWQVTWTPSARRTLAALPMKSAVVVHAFVQEVLANDPGRLGKPLRFELAGLHVARRGPYRVVYRIERDRREIVIHRVDLRAHAYRSRG